MGISWCCVQPNGLFCLSDVTPHRHDVRFYDVPLDDLPYFFNQMSPYLSSGDIAGRIQSAISGLRTTAGSNPNDYFADDLLDRWRWMMRRIFNFEDYETFEKMIEINELTKFNDCLLIGKTCISNGVEMEIRL